MKKVYAGIVAATICLSGSQAFALFTNGGFEDGTLNGWTIQYGSVDGYATSSPHWLAYPSSLSGQPAPAVINNTYHGLGENASTDINPYVGSKMVKINDVIGSYHATKISQFDSITAADMGKTVYVAWGAALIDPGHPVSQQPFFNIKVTKNGVTLDTFSASATNAAAPGSGWSVIGNYGGPLYYKTGVYSYNLSSFLVGDTIGVEMFAADCGQGGHGGYAFLDGVGTTPVVPTPEPATMLLFGAGLAGLVAASRRKEK